MANIFEKRASALGYENKAPSGNIFQQRAEQSGAQESGWKRALRTALQIPQGAAEATVPGMAAGLFQMIAQGEALDPEGLSQLRLAHEKAGIPFDEERYMQGLQESLGMVPTVSNIARGIEKEYGVPLEPKDRYQKGLRLGSTATKLAPTPGTFIGLKTGLPKPVLGAGVAGTSQILQEIGVPEAAADIGSFAILKRLPEGSPGLSIGKAKKPSGLTTRQYEKITTPKEITAGKKAKIESKVEDQFRGIAGKIIAESPMAETYSALKNDKTFKDAAIQSFRDVEFLADQVPGQISTASLKKSLVSRILQKKGTGFTPSEYDKAHKKFIKQFIQETPTQNITARDLVTQYRNNNKALKEVYEPGQSFAYNRAKRESLQDYNKTIAELIQEQYPNTEFANLFKASNEQWTKIMDAEAIDKFIDGIFNGKIRFEKGRQLLDKEGMTVPFKRALGPEGFKQFIQLNKDLLSTEQANRMLRVAAKTGFGDKLSTLAAYVMHPKIGYAKAGFDLAKGSYKTMVEFLLDKPQFALTWETVVKAFRKGDFKTATQAFEVLEAEQALEAKSQRMPQKH